MIDRVLAIIRADFLIRFRRVSTAVVFLLLSAFVYVWVPPPSSGRALMRVGNARVLYNSAAMGIATAMLASLFIGLVGFYVVSNAIRRDFVTRCGSVIASTGMRSGEYLAGKFAGNAIFLATFTTGFMLASMAMLVLRGEAPLEPWTFARQYVLLVPSTIVLVSAFAITFESVPLLSGRLGDVVYFVLWAVLMAVATAAVLGGLGWVRYLDFNGLAFLLEEVRRTHGATSVSIGAGPFDPALPVVVLSGLRLDAATLLPRVTSTLAPLALLLIARASFHRFDPALVKTTRERGGRGWGARLDRWFRPLAGRIAGAAMKAGRRPSIVRAAVADAMVTMASRPVSMLVAAAFAIGALAAPDPHGGVLPLAVAAFAVFVAGAGCRERRAGTEALVYATPLLRERFVAWKLLSSAVVAAFFLGVPLLRAAVTRPASLAAIVVAIALVCAAATSFAVISGNPKAFVVVFLTFWYVVVNDRGRTPALDFGGFFTAPAPSVMLFYAALGLAFAGAAQAMHAVRLRREG